MSEQVWRAVYWQHHVKDEDEFDSFDEALGFLWYGNYDAGSLSAESIVGPTGEKVEGAALEALMLERLHAAKYHGVTGPDN